MPETDWGWLIDPSELKEWTVQENDDILLINKPGLVVCHPSKKGPWSSLAGAIREYLEVDNVYLVSRLDRETSGIVLFAKRKPVTRVLQMALEQRKVSKTYLAIMEGEFTHPIYVNAPVGPDKHSLVRSKNTIKWQGRRQDATTVYNPLHSANGYTFVHVQPVTGRKHQIRAHALGVGHSITGDKLYGPDETIFLDFIDDGWTEKLAEILPIKRHALHAYRMTFHLPDGEQNYLAPLPLDLREFCQTKMNLESDQLDALIAHL